MRPPRSSAARLAMVGLSAWLLLPGCSSKTPEVDTAEVSTGPSVKPAPASAPAPAPAPTPSEPSKP